MNTLYIYLIVFIIVFFIFNSFNYQETFVDMIPKGIEVKDSKYLNNKSRGLYATKDFKKDDIVEICPTLIMKKKQVTKDNIINDHFFKGNIRDNELLSLGYCSIINHSEEKQNVTWTVSNDDETITILAIKNIKKGDELFSNYGSQYWNSRNLEKI